MTKQALGEALRFRREFLNIRQEDLAEMTETTSRTIHTIETGAGNPTIDILEKMATVLGMEISIQVKKAN